MQITDVNLTLNLNFFVNIAISVAVSLGVGGVFYWLIKNIITEKIRQAIKSEYDIKLESHKIELTSKSNIEIERLRSDLSRAASENNIVFAHLHEKRADVIANIYSTLKNVHHQLYNYVKGIEFSGEPSKEDRSKLLADAHKEFFDIYTKKLIFVPAFIAAKIDEINAMMVRTGNEFTYVVLNDQNPERMKKWVEVEERCSGPIKDALTDLEVEFRRLLGDKME
ncbi:hypothetical protein CU669_03490 [Paramagnetospirillum kuznetsovii]|uniref:Uncharacterized protein n=1 Tax=Paramagnetospirillum kuznetsovii TaxID=2053833 RepID=A0A364P1L9_9PROT|nr:hypothetical protein [Paramagnetospirillum kuznetsovii]RAU23232.1 hypothetical protein CU669_03490 [Paramagnetospirillum kuznetsovii]